MHAWDKPQKVVNINEPMFKTNKYGYTANLANHIVAAEYILYKERQGLPQHYPISDGERLGFEVELTKRYPEEFKAYVSLFGGIKYAKATMNAGSLPAPLLDYWLNKEEEYENTFSASRPGGWENDKSA